MDQSAATEFAPRIYCIDPRLVSRAGWSDLLERVAAMDFDHVLLCGSALNALMFAGMFAGDEGEPDATPPNADLDPDLASLLHMEQLEDLAHQCTEHRLRLLLELAPLTLTSPPVENAGQAAHEQALPDPRRAASGMTGLPAAPVAEELADPQAVERLLQCWQARLALLIDAGVAGFCCRAPARLPAALWRQLIERTREQRTCCHFLAWTPGCTHRQLEALVGSGFDAVFSSGAWWDFRAPWYFREYDKLAAIAPVLAFPEDPFGPRLARIHGFRDPQARRLGALRALHFASVSGAGWLLTMGFEFGLTEPLNVAGGVGSISGLASPQAYAQACAAAEFDLSQEVLRANREMAVRPQHGHLQLRPLSAPHATLLRIERRAADARQLIVVNPRLDSAVSVDDDPLADSLPPGAVRLQAWQTAPAVGADPNRRKKPSADKVRATRIAIEQVRPSVDDGRFAARYVAGQHIVVSADIFMDGHDQLAAAVLLRAADDKQWQRLPMREIGNDRWQAELSLQRLGRHYFCIEAWSDVFMSYRDGLRKKADAGQELTLELEEGRLLVAQLVEQGLENGVDKTVLERSAALLKSLAASAPAATRLALLQDDATAALVQQLTALAGARAFLARSAVEYPLEVERSAAVYANWYELFPRSQSGRADVHGTFDDVIARLPAIRAMGFDTLYFPPIHPIGLSNRKGKNNSLHAGVDEPGSPYAIGSAEGGHDAIHAQLGTLEDFQRLREAAGAHGMELALDFAIQCSPDHPWLHSHPGWFAWRPDGSLRYAENPPKKYQDIVNVDFYASDAIPELWTALRDVVLYWVQQGVQVFRVDNPHTKPLPFWEWLIAGVRSRHPQVIFLSEAFTRPKPMYRLAKLGFSQSYTYFTWRHGKQEFIDYLSELTSDAPGSDRPRDYFRPHFFVNTPDINPLFLQRSGRAGFRIRAALAATLSGLWGVYSGFELCEAQALPGKEEYLDSEKYEIRAWDWQRPGNIIDDITLLNRLRAENPALQSHLGVHFLAASNPQILYFAKATAGRDGRFGDNVVLVAINLDPFQVQHGEIEIPLAGFGLDDDGRLQVEDLLSERRFSWHGRYQPLTLDPQVQPYAAWRVHVPFDAGSRGGER